MKQATGGTNQYKRELSVDAMAEMEHLEVCYKLQDNVYLCLKNIRYIER